VLVGRKVYIMIVKQMELQNGRGLACEVSTLPQQACTLSSQWESCCLGVRMERYPIRP